VIPRTVDHYDSVAGHTAGAMINALRQIPEDAIITEIESSPDHTITQLYPNFYIHAERKVPA
jgi:hypothetical protein